MALVRDLSKFEINNWQSSVMFQPSQSTQQTDKMSHRWESPTPANIHLFEFLFFFKQDSQDKKSTNEKTIDS